MNKKLRKSFIKMGGNQYIVGDKIKVTGKDNSYYGKIFTIVLVTDKLYQMKFQKSRKYYWLKEPCEKNSELVDID